MLVRIFGILVKVHRSDINQIKNYYGKMQKKLSVTTTIQLLLEIKLRKKHKNLKKKMTKTCNNIKPNKSP